MADEKLDLLQGTLDVLILKALALEKLHGLGIARRIEQMTRNTFQVKAGSLFPALQRMKDKGWITVVDNLDEGKAVFYQLTMAGRRQLADKSRQWDRISAAMRWALKAE